MSVTRVSQIGPGRSANGKLDGRAYVVVFNVFVNDQYDGPGVVGNAVGIPGRYAPYVGYENFDDRFALCVSVDPEQDGDEWQKWKVTCRFDTNWNSANKDSSPEENPGNDPEDDPPIHYIEQEFVTERYTDEWNKKEIKNSAGQLIDGLERTACATTHVWERNYKNLSNGRFDEYQNTVNNHAIDDIAPETGLLQVIVPKPSYRNGVKFTRVQFRVRVNKQGWAIRPADRGTAVKNANGKLTRPTDELNQPFDGEVFLDGSGNMQRDPTAPIVYLPKKYPYEPKSWAALGLTT